MNPKTGAILAMSGLSRDTESGALQDNALGTFTNVFTPDLLSKVPPLLLDGNLL